QDHHRKPARGASGAGNACGAGGAGGASGAGGVGGAGGASGAGGAHEITSESVLITEKFLLKIAENLGDEYFQLGQLLGVPRPFIKRLENDYPRNTSRVTNEVLSKWRDTSEKRPNEFNMMEELINALADLDLTEVAEMTRRGCEITGVRSSLTSSFSDRTSPLLEEQSRRTSCNDENEYIVTCYHQLSFNHGWSCHQSHHLLALKDQQTNVRRQPETELR
ncbi:hypothetical protein LSAT2_017735, partial [Lamellibrachia satsuma]